MYQLIGIDQQGNTIRIYSDKSIQKVDEITSTNKNKKGLMEAIACTSLVTYEDVKLIFTSPKTKENIELPIMYYFDVFKIDSLKYCYRNFLLNDRNYLRFVIDGNYQKNSQNTYNTICNELMCSNLECMSENAMKNFEKFLYYYCRNYRKCRDAYFFLKERGIKVVCEHRMGMQDLIDFNEPLIGFATDRTKIYECLNRMDLNNISNEQIIARLADEFRKDAYYLSQHLTGITAEDNNRDDLFEEPYYKVLYPSYLASKKKRQLNLFDIHGNLNGDKK